MIKSKSAFAVLFGAILSPYAWTAIMVAIFVVEQIKGPTLVGGYWITVCLFAAFAARIAEAVEKIAEKQ